jgi:hypothetical protein
MSLMETCFCSRLYGIQYFQKIWIGISGPELAQNFSDSLCIGYFPILQKVLKLYMFCFNSTLSPYLSALDFFNSPVWNIQFDELNFLSTSNLNCTGYSRQKNPVQIREKILFIKLNISNWKIAKIKCRYIGGITQLTLLSQILYFLSNSIQDTNVFDIFRGENV